MMKKRTFKGPLTMKRQSIFSFLGMIKVAFLFLFLVFLVPKGLWAYDFRTGEYEEVRNLVMEMVKRYPPSQYHYVGLGRSPTPVMALVRALGASTSNVPLSAFRYGEKTKPDLTKEKYSQLSSHFGHYLPKKEELGSKKLLVLDNAQSGASLVAGHKYMKKFMGDQGFTGEVAKLGFDSPQFDRTNDLYWKQNFQSKEQLSLAGYPLIDEFFQNTDFDYYAEFDGFDIGAVASGVKEIAKLARNDRFDDLVQSFMAKLASDPAIASALPKGCGVAMGGYDRLQLIMDNLETVAAKADKTGLWKIPDPEAPILSRFPHLLLFHPSFGFTSIQASKVVNGYGANLKDKVKLVPSVARTNYNTDPDREFTVIMKDFDFAVLDKVEGGFTQKYRLDPYPHDLDKIIEEANVIKQTPSQGVIQISPENLQVLMDLLQAGVLKF